MNETTRQALELSKLQSMLNDCFARFINQVPEAHRIPQQVWEDYLDRQMQFQEDYFLTDEQMSYLIVGNSINELVDLAKNPNPSLSVRDLENFMTAYRQAENGFTDEAG